MSWRDLPTSQPTVDLQRLDDLAFYAICLGCNELAKHDPPLATLALVELASRYPDAVARQYAKHPELAVLFHATRPLR